MNDLILNKNQYLELEKLALGVFDPLKGFMGAKEVHSVMETMRLPDGVPFPLPILLDINSNMQDIAIKVDRLNLYFEGEVVGEIFPTDVFQLNKGEVALKVFGTDSSDHPGVDHLYKMGNVFVGGEVKLFHRVTSTYSDHELTPAETKAYFKQRGWKTIVGFQTRNVPHRAHEFLQRTALEQVDGLFIQPLVGQKKIGDFTAEAVLAGYKTLIQEFFRNDNVLLGVLSTSMRYAGPREAIFHAIVRRNFGCTHFIIGRDHAGVGNYYGKYDAHELSRQFEGELGIEIMRLHGPYHCQRCGGIVTEKTCPHLKTSPESTHQINGTDIRKILTHQSALDPKLMRPEIVDSLAEMKIFVD
ncbi:MAG: sulfate adenylyltransferase [Nitrospinae bacterium]|nr:sulfate adenylyltransferase [Nitrospinota bacterium]